MTDIEQKALALLNGCVFHGGYIDIRDARQGPLTKALCRAIEQHEAFRQEVSDAWTAVLSCFDQLVLDDRGKAAMRGARLAMQRFVLDKPVDPLVEALDECGFGVSSNAADDIRAALAARGLKIVEVGE